MGKIKKNSVIRDDLFVVDKFGNKWSITAMKTLLLALKRGTPKVIRYKTKTSYKFIINGKKRILFDFSPLPRGNWNRGTPQPGFQFPRFCFRIGILLIGGILPVVPRHACGNHLNIDFFFPVVNSPDNPPVTVDFPEVNPDVFVKMSLERYSRAFVPNSCCFPARRCRTAVP